MKITINDRKYEAKQGQTVLDVAKENGIYIPSLCYHAQIGALSRCRACVIEIEGMPGLKTACSTPVTDGMAVITNSQRVLEAQKLVVEFLLSAGTHNCADCPRYDDCKLKEAAHYLGIELDMTGPDLDSEMVSWFTAPYWMEAHGLGYDDGAGRRCADLSFNVDDSDELIRVVRDKCILCGLCVEACRKAQKNVIHFFQRSHYTKLVFDNDVFLGDSSCDHCGECIKVCPTAAMVMKKTIHVKELT